MIFKLRHASALAHARLHDRYRVPREASREPESGLLPLPASGRPNHPRLRRCTARQAAGVGASGRSLPFQSMIAVTKDTRRRPALPGYWAPLNAPGCSSWSKATHATRRRSNPNDIAISSSRCAPAQRLKKPASTATAHRSAGARGTETEQTAEPVRAAHAGDRSPPWASRQQNACRSGVDALQAFLRRLPELLVDDAELRAFANDRIRTVVANRDTAIGGWHLTNSRTAFIRSPESP